MKYETHPGQHIDAACAEAVKLAISSGEEVTFEFNGTIGRAALNESAETVAARWHADYEAAAKARRESPERAKEERQRQKELKKKMSAHMIESAKTEKEMREAKVPSPYTKEQLIEYIQSLVDREHDYGTCVYAMSMAAEAAFNYAAHILGVTGFQASCADLDFVRRTRRMDGPFMLIKAEDALYPQYDLRGKLNESLHSWKPWLKEQAAKKLEDTTHAHPDVIAHWKRLASQRSQEVAGL